MYSCKFIVLMALDIPNIRGQSKAVAYLLFSINSNDQHHVITGKSKTRTKVKLDPDIILTSALLKGISS